MTARPIADVPLPQWWDPLAVRAASVDARDITRFLPPDGRGTSSAVLILLGEDVEGPDVLVMQRADTLRHHAGQVSFPGGVAEPHDADPAATALRETEEEVGLNPDSATVVTTLPELWIPITGYRVTPVLAWWHAPHPVSALDPGEVAAVSRLPVRDLADPVNRLRVRHPSGYIGPAFRLDGLLIWGFTAGVVATMLRLGGWERPWDRERVLEVS
ncbi:MAG: NUDIX hydrolase [Stackebrandtia sp.]